GGAGHRGAGLPARQGRGGLPPGGPPRAKRESPPERLERQEGAVVLHLVGEPGERLVEVLHGEVGDRLEEEFGILAALALAGRGEALAWRGGDETVDGVVHPGEVQRSDVGLDAPVAGGARGGASLGAEVVAEFVHAERLGRDGPPAGAGEEVDDGVGVGGHDARSFCSIWSAMWRKVLTASLRSISTRRRLAKVAGPPPYSAWRSSGAW